MVLEQIVEISPQVSEEQPLVTPDNPKNNKKRNCIILGILSLFVITSIIIIIGVSIYYNYQPTPTTCNYGGSYFVCNIVNTSHGSNANIMGCPSDTIITSCSLPKYINQSQVLCYFTTNCSCYSCDCLMFDY